LPKSTRAKEIIMWQFIIGAAVFLVGVSVGNMLAVSAYNKALEMFKETNGN
jgi:hypothetical protein